MSNLRCENCGSKHFQEINGIVTCVACGSKYPNKSLGEIGLDDELKAKEIRRLVKANSRSIPRIWEVEPKTGLLTDEEILKYAPLSQTAKQIKFKNATSIIDKIRYNQVYQMGIIFTIILIIYLLIFHAMGVI